VNKNLFGEQIIETVERINIYADEIQEKSCPYTDDKWIYIGLVIDRASNSLLIDIINRRYKNNFDTKSPYFKKNDRIIHWSAISDRDTKNIAMRWLEYILNPESHTKFYGYILGINISKLNLKEFDTINKFNSIYNRFFRSAILYALKVFFPNKRIIVENIFHERGQQQHHKYFPWHCIYKIEESESNITFACEKIKFLPKSHRESEGGDRRSNLIQLCDLFLGVCTSLIHGIEKSETSHYREELADLFLPFLREIINPPFSENKESNLSSNIMIRFFPKVKTDFNEFRRYTHQFYTYRTLKYDEVKSGQIKLF